MASAQQVQWQEIQSVLSRSGQPIQQVPFAQYVLNVGMVQGGVINMAAAGEQAADRIRPRPAPPHVLPRAVAGFLDREQEQSAVGQALARGQVIDLHGPDGMGKTALISQAMVGQLPSAFPDGMVYLSARHESCEDLLQELFESFFETGGGHVKVSENDVRRSMAGKRALIAVDDANHLEEREAEALTQAVPQCALLIAGREQQVWQGVAVPLRGLPRDQAIALFERHWGQIPAEERPAVEAICEALACMPLAVIQTATAAAKRNAPLAQVLQEVRPHRDQRDPVDQAVHVIGSLLSEGERRLLGGLAAPGGASVDLEALEAITGLPLDKIDAYMARLQKMGLVHADDHRYSLDDGLRPYIRQYGADEEMRARAADYYRRRAGQLRGQSRDPDEENVMAALGYYYQRQQWEQVVEIVRAMEPYLATTGRWGQWRKRLHHAWQAARELGDRATEAWAQNQLGIVALSLADTAAATSFFEGALSIWQSLGDGAGMAIARWNLQILFGPPPPPPQKAKPPTRPGGGGSALPIVLAATAAVVTIVLGILIAVAIWPHPTPPPPPPTTFVPPKVELWLAAGCSRSYSPDEVLAIRFQSTVDGVVDLYWTGPQGEREFLFAEPVSAGRITSRDWDVPQQEGQWVLEADLNHNQDSARCDFAVEVPTQFVVPDRTPPPAPNPTAPDNKAEIPCSSEPVDVTLRWSPVDDLSGIAQYQVELVEIPYYPPVASTSTLQLEGSQVQALVSGRCGSDYSWRVRAVDGVGNVGAWSRMATFVVLTLVESDSKPPPAPTSLGPGSPDAYYPEKIGSCPLVLSWTAVSDPSGIERYGVRLQSCSCATDSCGDFQDLTAYETSLDITAQMPQVFSTPCYRWNVSAADNAGNEGPASAWRYFKFFNCP
jgi:hypothetical protein